MLTSWGVTDFSSEIYGRDYYEAEEKIFRRGGKSTKADGYILRSTIHKYNLGNNYFFSTKVIKVSKF
jgi:hypothetical protein